jgi:peptidoglycan/xylan/chitin deacetylase (PgdA/CDA1 family)
MVSAISLMLLAGCTSLPAFGLVKIPSATATSTVTPPPTSTPEPTATSTPEPTPEPTRTVMQILLERDPALAEALCRPAALPTLQRGQVLAPILLYHHVGEAALEANGDSTSRYNVTAADFEAQLDLLNELGYHSVGVSRIVAAITRKEPLPERPIAISFDDGWIDQYQTIFPLLVKHGIVGTFYIPSTYPGGQDTVSWENLAEMIKAGMEIGSHSQTHADLRSVSEEVAWREIRMSKVDLEKRLGITIDTFAYPFGTYLPDLGTMVSRAGYLGGAGLGPSAVQGLGSIYYMSRIEIHGDEALAGFLSVLPWHGEGTPFCD